MFLIRDVNHSCDPNCLLETWTVGNTYKVGLVTQKIIEVGSEGLELTVDYDWPETIDCIEIPCLCNSINCREILHVPRNRCVSFEDSSDMSEEIDESTPSGTISLGSSDTL